MSGENFTIPLISLFFLLIYKPKKPKPINTPMDPCLEVDCCVTNDIEENSREVNGEKVAEEPSSKNNKHNYHAETLHICFCNVCLLYIILGHFNRPNILQYVEF